MARKNSQVFPRRGCETAAPERRRQRIDRNGREIEALGPVQSALDKKPIAWQPFATDDLAHVVGEVLQR